MAFQLEEINLMAKADPQGFIQLGEDNYDRKLRDAAEQIIANLKESPVVRRAGPSGSGKTTSSLKLRD